jgi:hypothetical protein
MKDHLFYNLYDLWCQNVRPRDLNELDSRFEPMRHGYWVRQGSATQIILNLKGVKGYPVDISISRAIGYEDTKYLGD